MPSTYTSRLRVELQATGENDTTWGTKANSVFQHLEDAIAGYTQVSLGTSVSSSYTLSAANAATDEARMHMLKVDGQLASAITIYMPAAQKSYWIYNNTSGSTLHVGVNGAGAVSVTAGWSKVATDGSAVWLLAAPPTTYLNETSAGLIFAKLSASQSITGSNTFTSTVAFWGAVSASTINVTEKVSTSSLNVAAITSTSTLVATSASIAALGGTQLTFTSGTITNFIFTSTVGTNIYATSISSNAVYASIMYVGGSVVLTSAGLPSSTGKLLQRAYDEERAYSNNTGYTAAGADDTAPLITEGVEILTLTITPQSASSRIRVRAVVPIGANSANIFLTCLHRGSDALASVFTYHGGGGQLATAIVEFEEASPGVSPITYSVRVGGTGSATGFEIGSQGGIGARRYGGSLTASLVVEEITV